jgi:hypothetical protein
VFPAVGTATLRGIRNRQIGENQRNLYGDTLVTRFIIVEHAAGVDPWKWLFFRAQRKPHGLCNQHAGCSDPLGTSAPGRGRHHVARRSRNHRGVVCVMPVSIPLSQVTPCSLQSRPHYRHLPEQIDDFGSVLGLT